MVLYFYVEQMVKNTMRTFQYHELPDDKRKVGKNTNYIFIVGQLCAIIVAFRALSRSFAHHYVLEMGYGTVPDHTK